MSNHVSTIWWFLHGVIGLIKAASGFDKAPTYVVTARKQVCKNCDHRSWFCCRLCGCFLPAKIRVDSEICPINLWWC